MGKNSHKKTVAKALVIVIVLIAASLFFANSVIATGEYNQSFNGGVL